MLNAPGKKIFILSPLGALRMDKERLRTFFSQEGVSGCCRIGLRSNPTQGSIQERKEERDGAEGRDSVGEGELDWEVLTSIEVVSGLMDVDSRTMISLAIRGAGTSESVAVAIECESVVD